MDNVEVPLSMSSNSFKKKTTTEYQRMKKMITEAIIFQNKVFVFSKTIQTKTAKVDKIS